LAGEFGANASVPRETTKAYNVKLINLLLQNNIGGLWWQWSRNHGLQGISEEIFSESNYEAPAMPPIEEPVTPNPTEVGSALIGLLVLLGVLKK